MSKCTTSMAESVKEANIEAALQALELIPRYNGIFHCPCCDIPVVEETLRSPIVHQVLSTGRIPGHNNLSCTTEQQYFDNSDKFWSREHRKDNWRRSAEWKRKYREETDREKQFYDWVCSVIQGNSDPCCPVCGQLFDPFTDLAIEQFFLGLVPGHTGCFIKRRE